MNIREEYINAFVYGNDVTRVFIDALEQLNDKIERLEHELKDVKKYVGMDIVKMTIYERLNEVREELVRMGEDTGYIDKRLDEIREELNTETDDGRRG